MTDMYNRRTKPLNDEEKAALKKEEVSNETPVENIQKNAPSKKISSRFGHILTNSKAFKTLTAKAFDACDADGSGAIDKSELYAGMLLIHLNLAKYAGPAACYPPTRTVCEHLFQAADWDGNDTIDRQEFAHIISVLCAQILQRMMIYYLVLILMVPILAARVVGVFRIGNGSFWDMAATQTISMSLFFLAIPLIWNKIDESSERRLMRQSTVAIQRQGQTS